MYTHKKVLRGSVLLASLTLCLLTLGANATAQDKGRNGMSPLMNAAQSGNATKAKTLLQAGASVDATDKQGLTALMWTATWTTYDVILIGYEEQHADVARALLDAGANINRQDNSGKTALIYAAVWDHMELARALLKRGADVNLRDKQGRSALTYAAWHGDGKDTLAASLLDSGLRMNAIEALLLQKIPQARRLIDMRRGARDLGPRGETALMLAALQGDVELVRALLAQGADANAREDRGFTALMMAVGATPYYGMPPGSRGWREARRVTPQERETILLLLLTHKAQVNKRDKEGDTALMWSAERGNESMARRLLKSGVDVNAKDRYGNTALQLAKQQNNPAIVTQLKAAGARE